ATRPGSRRPGTRSACEPTARRSRGPGGSRSPSRGARVAGSPCTPTSRSHHLTLAWTPNAHPEEGAMHIGVCMFNTDYAIRIEELARTVEERRFESLFVPEHTHIPASRRTPFPSGGELPREYSHTLDPFVALAHAAAVTTRIRLGTGICLIIERDTITTA